MGSEDLPSRFLFNWILKERLCLLRLRGHLCVLLSIKGKEPEEKENRETEKLFIETNSEQEGKYLVSSAANGRRCWSSPRLKWGETAGPLFAERMVHSVGSLLEAQHRRHTGHTHILLLAHMHACTHVHVCLHMHAHPQKKT